jgi:hypothetical protein
MAKATPEAELVRGEALQRNHCRGRDNGHREPEFRPGRSAVNREITGVSLRII